MKFAHISWIAFLSLAVLSPLAQAQWPADICVRIVVPFASIGRSFEPQGLARALIEPPRDPVQ